MEIERRMYSENMQWTILRNGILLHRDTQRKRGEPQREKISALLRVFSACLRVILHKILTPVSYTYSPYQVRTFSDVAPMFVRC